MYKKLSYEEFVKQMLEGDELIRSDLYDYYSYAHKERERQREKARKQWEKQKQKKNQPPQ